MVQLPVSSGNRFGVVHRYIPNPNDTHNGIA
jgi:hypothetical protein